jgi:acetyl-CoA acetyltransferase
MALSDVAIVAYAEAKNVVRSNRDVWDFSGEILDGLLDRAGIERDEVDGIILSPSQTGSSTPFWVNSTLDYLGLETHYSDTTDLGGCSSAAGVARAAAAIGAGLCEVVVLINADAPTTDNQMKMRSFHAEWEEPTGLMGPPGAFGLLSRRYQHQYGIDFEGLGKLAVAQREHAVRNPNAVEKLRQRITVEDYMQSRMIADPLRLLDCVMPCDGGNGLVMMSRKRARQKGYSRFVVPTGYGECTNFEITRNDADITRTGHSIAGERAFRQAGIRPSDVASFHPYDDFLIAMVLTMEMLGFCKPGHGFDFVREHDFRFDGDLPLNTGGGQISGGQPGLAGGGSNLTEAVRQLFGEGGERQVANTANALVTGIGWIPYGRNWGSSLALVLVPDA